MSIKRSTIIPAILALSTAGSILAWLSRDRTGHHGARRYGDGGLGQARSHLRSVTGLSAPG